MALKTRASSYSRLLKVLSIHGKQIPYEPAGNFESSPIGIAFLSRRVVDGT